MVGKLGALVLEKELGWDGVEGCTAMLVVMSTDVDKEVQAECKQTPRYRSSKQSLKIAIKKTRKGTYRTRWRMIRWLAMMMGKIRLLMM